MSRYFTSPPPVYARNWANGQNLVESTKIERQVVASRKVQKKEKNKQKNEKSIKQQYFPTKQVSDESEQLEKSCLTEEQEQHHYVGYLSDGSHNSKKRRSEASPAVVSHVKATCVAGMPLRIRFVFKKPKEAEVVPQEDPFCSTSGNERPSEISRTVSGLNTCDHCENLLSTSLENDEPSVLSESKKRKKHKLNKESRYNSLFEELVPSFISMKEDDRTSNDWLFGTRRQEHISANNDEEKTINFQIAGDFSSYRAHCMSEVGIFSLPYTVPF